jgi:hypothetical protein
MPFVLPRSWKSHRDRTAEVARFQKKKLQYLMRHGEASEEEYLLMCATGFREAFQSSPKFLRNRIVKKYRQQIEADNEILSTADVEKLSTRQVQEALYFRGEDVLPLDFNWEKMALYSAQNGRNLPYGNPDTRELQKRLSLCISKN